MAHRVRTQSESQPISIINMRICDLLAPADCYAGVPTPEMNVFIDADALAECALVDARLDMINSDAWLMFDCRGALQIEEGNTAVVVVHGVTEFRWQTVGREGRTWRSVMGSEANVGHTTIEITVHAEPTGQLKVRGTTAAFFVGNVPGGDDPPPDFVSATNAEISRGMASYLSEFNIVGASFVELSATD